MRFIVRGGRSRPGRLDPLRRICAGRDLVSSVHGRLAINLMDDPWRIAQHMQVLEASLEVAAEIGAVNYMLHGGLTPQQQAPGVEDAFARGQSAPAKPPRRPARWA
ncbi:hypothetical protein [Rhodovulum viride]|uniref:hypothetical protein n=1 Tax=Rhodovulum viride TaxID=1231134 RepID=UPI0015EBDE55|nr:hypothetical protein [Rhodovulum viride]